MVSGAPWVLKKFQIDYTGESGAYLYIEARQPGLMAFILNLMGLDPNASVKVTRGAISMRQSSMRGMDQVSTALTSVGAFIGGYSKPIGYLVAAAIFVIAGICAVIAKPIVSISITTELFVVKLCWNAQLSNVAYRYEMQCHNCST